jgi:hypothetical protein
MLQRLNKVVPRPMGDAVLHRLLHLTQSVSMLLHRRAAAQVKRWKLIFHVLILRAESTWKRTKS